MFGRVIVKGLLLIYLHYLKLYKCLTFNAHICSHFKVLETEFLKYNLEPSQLSILMDFKLMH